MYSPYILVLRRFVMALHSRTVRIANKHHKFILRLRAGEDGIGQDVRFARVYPVRELPYVDYQIRQLSSVARESVPHRPKHNTNMPTNQRRHTHHYLPTSLPQTLSPRNKSTGRIPSDQLLRLRIQSLLLHKLMVSLEEFLVVDLCLQSVFGRIELESADDLFAARWEGSGVRPCCAVS